MVVARYLLGLDGDAVGAGRDNGEGHVQEQPVLHDAYRLQHLTEDVKRQNVRCTGAGEEGLTNLARVFKNKNKNKKNSDTDNAFQEQNDPFSFTRGAFTQVQQGTTAYCVVAYDTPAMPRCLDRVGAYEVQLLSGRMPYADY